MDCLHELKEILKDFKPCSDEIDSSTIIEMSTIDYKHNPLTPALLSYCFDNILGFEVHYRIFEKINYIISFSYKGLPGKAIHRKLSYELIVPQQFEDEIITILANARSILEKLFMEYGKSALESNSFTMENESYYYSEKISFYSNRIEDLRRKAGELKKQQKEQVSLLISDHKKWTETYNHYSHLLFLNSNEQLYSFETYIDTYFSYLEHILTLLYPFTKKFDISSPYCKNKIHNTRWTWDKKIADISTGKQEFIDFVDQLRKIKEIYRNRNAHGLFSREMSVYAKIDGFGRYPIFVGKNYLQGFIEDNNYSLNYDKYCEIKKLFDGFLKFLHNEYTIPMVFIDYGVDIPVEVSIINKGIRTVEDAKATAERIIFEKANQINMDW